MKAPKPTKNTLSTKSTKSAKPTKPTQSVKSTKATQPTKSTKPAKPTPPASPSATVWRLKVLCIAGPWWDSDDVCVRTIDVLDNSTLYDLHAAILESVHFEEHDESVFTFFTAMDFRGRRTYLGDGQPLTHHTDIEQFEDIPLATALPKGGRQFLYYVFDADDPWVFLIGRDNSTRPPSPHEFYPYVRDELNRGPDPVQHGDGLDDFADADEGAEFHELREDFRRHRREREESGLDEDGLNDDGDFEDGDEGEGFVDDDGFFFDDEDDEEDGDEDGGEDDDGDDDDGW